MTTALNQYPYPLINQPTGPPYVDNTGNIAANTLQPPRKVPVASYNGFAGCSTGWIQLCCGVATILLASAQIILQTTLNIIGHGIWGGVVVSDYHMIILVMFDANVLCIHRLFTMYFQFMCIVRCVFQWGGGGGGYAGSAKLRGGGGGCRHCLPS